MKFADWRAPVLVIVLASAALLAWLAAGTPRPLGPDAPPAAFSAERAMTDDRAIAAKPHPTGSAEAGLVRSFLMQRMQAMGLEPRLQDGVAVEEPRWVKDMAMGARVENLVGVLKGTNPSLPAVVLMAHSDSVPASPGAADDAAGVASAFEVIRALRAQGPHKRDVAVLITDGEEAGLLGARAFFASGDPLLKHMGEVVNLEARGGGGRVNMFQLADRDGGHMALFAKTVGNTNANSLTSEVYKYMPNDTDFTVSRQAGVPGYNFAFIGMEFDYHAPSSTPAVLDQGSLQHMGDQALAITRALADADTLPGKAGDWAYSDLFGHGVLAYPAVAGGWALLLVSVLLASVAAWRGQQVEGARPLRPGPMAWGAIGALLIVLVAAAVLWAGAQLSGLGDFIRHRALLAHYPLFLTGFALLTIGAALFMVGPVQRGHAWTLLVGKSETRWSAWAGVFLLLTLLCLFLQVRFPPMAMLAEWPLFAAALLMLGVAFLGRARFEAPISIGLAGVIGLLAVTHLDHFADQTFTAVGEMAPEALALFVGLALPVLFPLLARWGRLGVIGQLGALATLAVGVIVLAYAALHQPWSARTPRYVQAFYLQDSAAGKSYRASGLEKLDPWSAGVLSAGAAKPVRRDIPALRGPFWVSPAPEAGEQRPTFTSGKDGDAVVVHLAPKAGGRELRLTLTATSAARDVTIEGRPAHILAVPGKPSLIRWSAPAEGVTLRFVPTAAHGELDLLYAEVKDGWPEGHRAAAKPSTSMPFGLSDTTVITDELKTKW